MFMLDVSKGIEIRERIEEITFVKRITEQLSVSQNEVNIGLMTFSSRPMIPIPLRKYSSSIDIVHAIEEVRHDSISEQEKY